MKTNWKQQFQSTCPKCGHKINPNPKPNYPDPCGFTFTKDIICPNP